MCTEQSLWMTLIYLHSRGMCFGTNALCIVHIWFPNQTLKMFAFNCITTVTAAGLECQYLHILLKTFTCVQGPRTIREIWALVSAGWDLFIYPFSSLPSKCLRMSFLKGSTVFLAQTSQHQAVRVASDSCMLNYNQDYKLKAPPCIHVQLLFEM